MAREKLLRKRRLMLVVSRLFPSVGVRMPDFLFGLARKMQDEFYMEPHWVSIRDRMPDLDKEVQVLVVELGFGIGYARAKLTRKGWVFLTAPLSTEVAQWLEADRMFSDEEIREILPPPLR